MSVPSPTRILRTARDRMRARLAPALVGRTARTVKRDRLTYLSWSKLRSLERAADHVISAGVPGDFVEAGIALGGSGVLLASRLDAGRAFHGYDVFGMIPAPSARDHADAHERFARIAAGRSAGLEGDTYYGYVDDLRGRVEATFARYGVPLERGRIELHAGLFEDTLHPPGPVALAHIDSDWYEPVRTCLERIHPQLSPGGLLVLDDYADYAGCADAAHEFLAAVGDLRVVRGTPHLILRRL
jgi:O-methyltransferase